MNFFTAVACDFCPSLPAAFTQPGASALADVCNGIDSIVGDIQQAPKVAAAKVGSDGPIYRPLPDLERLTSPPKSCQFFILISKS